MGLIGQEAKIHVREELVCCLRLGIVKIGGVLRNHIYLACFSLLYSIDAGGSLKTWLSDALLKPHRNFSPGRIAETQAVRTRNET